jgi:hypothetical protein
MVKQGGAATITIASCTCCLIYALNVKPVYGLNTIKRGCGTRSNRPGAGLRSRAATERGQPRGGRGTSSSMVWRRIGVLLAAHARLGRGVQDRASIDLAPPNHAEPSHEASMSLE